MVWLRGRHGLRRKWMFVDPRAVLRRSWPPPQRHLQNLRFGITEQQPRRFWTEDEDFAPRPGAAGDCAIGIGKSFMHIGCNRYHTKHSSWGCIISVPVPCL